MFASTYPEFLRGHPKHPDPRFHLKLYPLLWLSAVSTFSETDCRGRAGGFVYVLEVSWEESYDGTVLEEVTGSTK
jgi:hypothetical protein